MAAMGLTTRSSEAARRTNLWVESDRPPRSRRSRSYRHELPRRCLLVILLPRGHLDNLEACDLADTPSGPSGGWRRPGGSWRGGASLETG
jgi:hypothetical protein